MKTSLLPNELLLSYSLLAVVCQKCGAPADEDAEPECRECGEFPDGLWPGEQMNDNDVE